MYVGRKMNQFVFQEMLPRMKSRKLTSKQANALMNLIILPHKMTKTKLEKLGDSSLSYYGMAGVIYNEKMPDTLESVNLIKEFAVNSHTANDKNGYNSSLQMDIYNMTFEMLGVYGKDLVNKLGKGNAMVTMGKILAIPHLQYGMGVKVNRGNPGWTTYGNSVSFGPKQYRSDRAQIDCTGFVNELLHLVGENNHNYDHTPKSLTTGIGLHGEKYGRTDLGLSKDELNKFSRFDKLDYAEKIALAKKINRPGVIMAQDGYEAAGHIWVNTGEWKKDKNGKIIGMKILESAGNPIGTRFRSLNFNDPGSIEHYYKRWDNIKWVK